MRTTIRTSDRTAEIKKRRRKKKKPSPSTVLRIEWLNWLVEKYGADAVAEWQAAPVSFEDWRRARELAAHEAA